MFHKLLLVEFIILSIAQTSFAQGLDNYIRSDEEAEQILGAFETNIDYETVDYFEDYEDILKHIDWLTDDLTLENLLANNISEQCSQDFDLFVRKLRPPPFGDRWAWEMADSTGKFEAGVIQGNAVFEGRYPQCIEAHLDATDAVVGPYEPMYCVTSWKTILPRFFRPEKEEEGKQDDSFLYLYMKSQNHQNGRQKRTPSGESYLRIYQNGLGFCIPSSCTNDDAMTLFYTVYTPSRPIQNWTNVDIHCERGEDLSQDTAAIVTITILALFGTLVLLASCYDYRRYRVHKNNQSLDAHSISDIKFTKYDLNATDPNSNQSNSNEEDETELQLNVIKLREHKVRATEMEQSEKYVLNQSIPGSESNESHETTGLCESILLCFSLYNTLPEVVTFEHPTLRMRCLNGICAIAMAALIFGHTYDNLANVSNNVFWWPTFIREGYGKLLSMDWYVDTFFIISAFLTTLSLLEKLKQEKGNLKLTYLLKYYADRYWRRTSIYAIVLMVYANLGHYFIHGPYAKHYFADVDTCSTEWWKNLLYINNLDIFITEGKHCMSWSWYLSVEMQFFVVSPLFIYLLYRWEKVGISAVILGFCGGMIANAIVWDAFYDQFHETYKYTVDSLTDIYIKPWIRCPVYFMGMMLGFIFYKTNGNIRIPKLVVLLGWVVGISMVFICDHLPKLLECYFVTLLVLCDWSWSARVAWSVFFRPMWGIWVCWLITACCTGNAGFVNTFLSWNFFVPLRKLDYVCYLISMIIVLISCYSTPVQMFFSTWNAVYLFFGNIALTYIFGLVLSACVYAPLLKLPYAFKDQLRKKNQ